MTGPRSALIIATDRYAHPGLRDLRAPAADADALSGVLGDPRIGNFRVEVARNEPAHALQARIEDLFRQAMPGDVLLVHFSCHGLKDESGDLFFAAADTHTRRLASTTVPAEFVQRCMYRSRSRRVLLLLDCCYGGAFPSGARPRAAGDVRVFDSFPPAPRDTGRGRMVITASTAMEFALEGGQVADDHRATPSVFTAALAEGLATGDADLDGDGWISAGELYDYVYAQVRARNPGQTPTSQGELVGQLHVAQSVKGTVRCGANIGGTMAASPADGDPRPGNPPPKPRVRDRSRLALLAAVATAAIAAILLLLLFLPGGAGKGQVTPPSPIRSTASQSASPSAHSTASHPATPAGVPETLREIKIDGLSYGYSVPVFSQSAALPGLGLQQLSDGRTYVYVTFLLKNNQGNQTTPVPTFYFGVPQTWARGSCSNISSVFGVGGYGNAPVSGWCETGTDALLYRHVFCTASTGDQLGASEMRQVICGLDYPTISSGTLPPDFFRFYIGGGTLHVKYCVGAWTDRSTTCPAYRG